MSVNCTVLVVFHLSAIVPLFDMTVLDQLIPISNQSNYQGPQVPARLSGGAIKVVARLRFGITAAFNALAAYGKNNQVPVQGRPTARCGSAPYLSSSSPSIKAGAAGGGSAPSTPAWENFGQPDVIFFGLARQRA